MDIIHLKEKLKELNIIRRDGRYNSNLTHILTKHTDVLCWVEEHTKFLDNVSQFQRIYTIINDITSIPVCVRDGCNHKVKFNRKYNSFCSSKCISLDKTIQEKKKQTSLKNYGVENPAQADTIKQKKIDTTQVHYGVRNPFESEIIKAKIKKTCKEKYDTDYYVQSLDFNDKFIKSMLENHGVVHALQSPMIKENMQQTCMKRYGVPHISRRHISHDTMTKLNDKEWLYKQHIIDKIPLLEIAKGLDVLDWTVGKYLHKHNIETQTYFSSTGENAVLSFITSHNIETISNTRSVIPPYELDIYIPSHNLAIEYCGLYWHSEQAGKDSKYHKRKYDMCREQGIQLITIFEDEWLNRNEQVKSKLESLLHVDNKPKVFARKTTIINVSSRTKKLFFDKNHIQGNGPGSINIGLLYADELVAAMTFIKRINGEYELNRYATSAKVIGGFSKLLKYFINEYEPKQIISFADLRWSDGNLYKQTGWLVDKILPPDYSYSPDAKQRVHKFGYRRKNLDRLLHSFDPELSEKVNCDNNGILRIWDCGKIRFKYPLTNSSE